MSNVSFLSDRNNSSLSWSVNQMLESVAVEIQKGEVTNKKAVLILLDTDNGAYTVNHYQAGMRYSEILSLIEIMKTTIVKHMGY